MRILFTSDLHNDRRAVADFAYILATQDFAVGVIAGDLLNKDSDEEDELWLKFILSQAKKPVLIIRGNQDLTALCDYKNIKNIHLERVCVGKYTVVGYGFVKPAPSEEEQRTQLEYLKTMVDESALLVTHKPPVRLVAEKRPLYVKYLREILEEKTPRFYLFGHFHGGSIVGTKPNYLNGAYSAGYGFVAIDVDNQRYETIRRCSPSEVTA